MAAVPSVESMRCETNDTKSFWALYSKKLRSDDWTTKTVCKANKCYLDFKIEAYDF